MSYSFYVKLDSAPTYAGVLAALAVDDLATDVGPPEEVSGEWRDGHVLRVWRTGISTRPIELAWEDGGFSARILTCSCAEDYRLALDAVCSVADEVGCEVESEEGVRFAPDGRGANYGDDWIEEQVDFSVRAVLTMAHDAETWATLQGPTFDFHIGRKLADELDRGSSEERRDALFTKMRELFYPDPETVYLASALVAELTSGRKVSLAILQPGIATVLPPVDMLVLQGEIEVPFDALEELVGGDRITWLDEACPLIEAIGEDDWPALEKRARGLDVPLLRGDGSDHGERLGCGPSPMLLLMGIALVAAVLYFFL